MSFLQHCTPEDPTINHDLKASSNPRQ